MRRQWAKFPTLQLQYCSVLQCIMKHSTFLETLPKRSCCQDAVARRRCQLGVQNEAVTGTTVANALVQHFMSYLLFSSPTVSKSISMLETRLVTT